MRRVRRAVFWAGLVSGALLVGVGGSLALAGTAAPAASASSPTGTWGTASNVPGTSPVDGAEVAAISCAPGAECTAVGNGLTSGGSGSAFAVTEKNGAWGKAAPIPGAASVGQFGGEVTSVSCPASGDCLAVGTTLDGGWYAQEVKGHWGKAATLPGLQNLSTSDIVFSLLASCSSPGDCAVAGEYLDAAGTDATGSVFVASQAGGHWVPAAAVAGVPSTANSIPEVIALSCASPGDCVIGGGVLSVQAQSVGGGSVRDRALRALRSARAMAARGPARPAAGSGSLSVTAVPFVASEVGGAWQAAVQPSLGLTPAGIGLVTSAACPPGGGCVAAGFYAASDAASALAGSFLVTQAGATWSAATTNSTLAITGLACPAAGHCTAAGWTSAASPPRPG